MENNTNQSRMVKDLDIFKPTDKQCSNHHLLHTVRQINGDMAFRQICQKCLIVKFNKRISIPERFTQDHFSYILQGEVYVYKNIKNQKENPISSRQQPESATGKGIFITCHKGHEIFGLQQYPLNVVEILSFEAGEGTKIMVFPIEFSLTSFKKIFNMTVVQYRAEVLKQNQFFKEIQIEKLKRIALYSKRYQLLKGQIIQKEQIVKQFLLLVISGDILCLDQGQNKTVYVKDMTIGLKQIIDGQQQTARSELICLSDCELMLIPKVHIIKSYKIKYRLQEKESGQFRSRRVTEYDTIENYDSSRIKYPTQKKAVLHSSTEEHFSRKNFIRPNTSVPRKSCLIRDMKSMTFYPSKGAPAIKKYVKTQISDRSNYDHGQSIDKVEGLNAYRSLGQMCLRKFLSRKEKRQNCEIMKYIKSNAPELKLNPSKEYAVMKPLHVANSSYIKNYKRKLRKTYVKTEGSSNKNGKPEAKFSLFFQEQIDA